MDSSDRYKVSEQDAAVWTLISKLIRAAQGDPFEASRRVAELIAPILDDAERWRKVKEIAGRNWLDEYPCEGCSVADMCDSSLSLCGQADSIVNALDGEVKG